MHLSPVDLWPVLALTGPNDLSMILVACPQRVNSGSKANRLDIPEG